MPSSSSKTLAARFLRHLPYPAANDDDDEDDVNNTHARTPCLKKPVDGGQRVSESQTPDKTRRHPCRPVPARAERESGLSAKALRAAGKSRKGEGRGNTTSEEARARVRKAKSLAASFFFFSHDPHREDEDDTTARLHVRPRYILAFCSRGRPEGRRKRLKKVSRVGGGGGGRGLVD
ncbi:hypothetical protein C0Q70_15901 [Pomacea canaliculata]|uniref:Uncharacterized protein n=1 Tax=Pomacea canaliculata TaxID=400727 RepID=A0A2T7NNB1_POMCA|nr:hypothetical protein C0Q70_15901 [Pomacea canaliculata]